MKSSSEIPATTEYATESTYMASPDNNQWLGGVEPQYTLPASWWNFFMNLFTNTNIEAKGDINNVLTELTAILTAAELTPNPAVNNQLLTAINTFLALKENKTDNEAADILVKLKTVDGLGSGLDADLLDSIESARIIYGSDIQGTQYTTNLDAIAKSGFYSCPFTGTGVPMGTYDWLVAHVQYHTTGSYGFQIALPRTGGVALSYIRVNNNGWQTWQKLWNAGNDGPGSVLDADTLDGLQGSEYVKYDLVIDSDAKFLQWQTSGTYAKVLIKTGVWLLPTGGIDLTARGTKVVVGEPGSTLAFTGTAVLKCLYYTTKPTSQEYYMKGVYIEAGFAANPSPAGFVSCINLTNCGLSINISINDAMIASGFFSCDNLINCKSILGTISSAGNTMLRTFAYCNRLINCNAIIKGHTAANDAHVGYFSCTGLVNCDYADDNTAVINVAASTGFSQCKYLTGCVANAQVEAGLSIALGFQLCEYLTLCKGTGNTPGTGIGFQLCEVITNCEGIGTAHSFQSCKKMQQNKSSGGVYNTSYASSIANATYICADTPNGGFNS